MKERSVLVDTSVWEAARKRAPGVRARLEQLLADDLVFTHPFVVGECALGGADVELAFAGVHHAPLLDQRVLLRRVGALGVIGRKGVGWVDVNLLATALDLDLELWTLNRGLAEAHAAVASRFAGE